MLSERKNTKNGEVPSASKPPLIDGKEALPHYTDVIPEDALNPPTAGPTAPGKEPMAEGSKKQPENITDKSKDLDQYRVESKKGSELTLPTGIKVANNQSTLRAGVGGPSLIEDFLFLNKMAHFDRERIPERVVHARGSAAHGYFQLYESLENYTKAAFLCDTNTKTPVFVRFSTVQGFRGSSDTVRDIRGFATKFFTLEGNYDLVGNNTPVFFIQDALKFPDFVHAVKPQPHNQIPQGSTAHDSFWDYVSLQPETLHNVLWAMSDRGIPRSYRTMEGFGIHTFKLINKNGDVYSVRFHWKPVSGKASLLFDEALLIAGKDPDFHRRDLWQAIEAGHYPEYELGLQMISTEEENKLGFDILDATKLIPEAIVPVKIVGKMVLNRNPDNFYAETEQVAFCPANVVPGIDFSNDPLLQGRIFSYTDTQRHRLGNANFDELPINRPICPFLNHQRDGQSRLQINIGANYEPNSINGNRPREVPEKPQHGGFDSIPNHCSGEKVRKRSESFADYYSQPRLFWISLTGYEKKHVVNAISFELAKVMRQYIRERVIDLLSRIDTELAKAVATNLGIQLDEEQLIRKLPDPVCELVDGDPSLSLYLKNNVSLKSKRVALLVADGVNGNSLQKITNALEKEGIFFHLLSYRMGKITTTEEDGAVEADGTMESNPSIGFDAVIVPEGSKSIATLMCDGNATYYIRQAYKHLKPIALPGEAQKMSDAAAMPSNVIDSAYLVQKSSSDIMKPFIEALSRHRCWEREEKIFAFAA